MIELFGEGIGREEKDEKRGRRTEKGRSVSKQLSGKAENQSPS